MIRTAAPISAALVVWLGMLLWGGLESPLDNRIGESLYAGDNAVLADLARFATELGGWIVLTLVTLGAVIWLVRRQSRRSRAAILIFTVLVGRMFVELQKITFGRLRPTDEFHLVTVDSFSFPSGHAANATITYLAIALLLPQARSGKAMAVGAAFILAAAIGLSRIVLGVHWPSDVMAGWAFGLFWVFLCLRLSSAREAAQQAETAEPGARPRRFGQWRRGFRKPPPPPASQR
ncbi:phosphatase PAP2 family protein [Allosphingosinicella indica]|uniref:Undecaprenyl-diphosphatase n=1 Tax=Allosphingosinicella indica TaxID=941907 RepID=A0A1X7FYV4_9SPHN|nr:phosphatase PAP2 family protein [Allosphingosinicella indica]SMF61288.1 undecaprenyl-diphosphatase [Allosphingosinicella indica]